MRRAREEAERNKKEEAEAQKKLRDKGLCLRPSSSCCARTTIAHRTSMPSVN
jgi:hypothetical protein